MRVLICGGRDYGDQAQFNAYMDDLHKHSPVDRIIHGAAPGADTLAGVWAFLRSVSVDVFKANWREHGRAAGPLRNQRMIDEGKPDLVVAFPGGRGTADMVRRAKAAGVEVRKVAA